MEFMDCVRFANENPVAWFATDAGDQPRVRALLMSIFFSLWPSCSPISPWLRASRHKRRKLSSAEGPSLPDALPVH